MPKSYALVINLKSRQSADALNEIKAIFKSSKRELKIYAVKDPKKINGSFQQALNHKPDVVILGGGDGTLISGIEYLSTKGYAGKIGLLPLGTANYLARNLELPLDIKGSIDSVLKGKSREVPVGIANGKLFALTFVIGLTQAASEHVSDSLKKKIGQFAYIAELLKQTKDHEVFEYVIESPDLKTPLKGKSHQVLVYNSDLNQQIKLVPDHALQKQSLKVVISRGGESKLKLYAGFLTHILTAGKIRPYMKVFETRSLKITTKPRLKADYDGEPYGHSPFEVEMYKRKIRLIC